MGANELIVALVTSGIVLACVLLHTEVLQMLWFVAKGSLPARMRIAWSVLVIVVLHVLEIWLFAIGNYLLLRNPEFGSMQTTLDGSIFDFVYYSATVYTTLGFGDIIPVGPIRFLTGVEALMGLILITWSASFMFLEMQRFWSRE
jgi:hypothetical protein